MGDCFSAPVALCCGAMFCCYGGVRCCAEAIRDPPGYTGPNHGAGVVAGAEADVDGDGEAHSRSELRKKEEHEEQEEEEKGLFPTRTPRRRKRWWRAKSKRDPNVSDDTPLI